MLADGVWGDRRIPQTYELLSFGLMETVSREKQNSRKVEKRSRKDTKSTSDLHSHMCIHIMCTHMHAHTAHSHSCAITCTQTCIHSTRTHEHRNTHAHAHTCTGTHTNTQCSRNLSHKQVHTVSTAKLYP